MTMFTKRMAWLVAATLFTLPIGAAAQQSDEAQPGPGYCNGDCPGRGRMGRGGHHRGGRMFDPKAVTTVQGQIEEVKTNLMPRGEGVHLTLAVGSEKLEVVVGPKFFLDDQKLKLAKGDKVEVKGSRTTWGDTPVLVAQEIRKGSEVLTLRDAEGFPLWRGQGRR